MILPARPHGLRVLLDHELEKLGVVADMGQQFDAAEAAFKEALDINIACQADPQGALHGLANLWRNHDSANIPTTVATVMNINLAEAEELLTRLVSNRFPVPDGAAIVGGSSLDPG